MYMQGKEKFKTSFGGAITALTALVITVQASLLCLRLFQHRNPTVTAYNVVRDPSTLGSTGALEVNFDLAVQIMDKNDLGFSLDSSLLSFVAQIETIPKAGVLEVQWLEKGLVPCET